MSLIDTIYRQVPTLDCKGLCQAACGPIGCSSIEAETLQNNGIIPPGIRVHPTQGDLTCSHLSDAGRCTIYEHRPLVCRLYGAVKKLQCPHGCKPKGGFLPDAKAKELLDQLDAGQQPHFGFTL